MCRFFFFLPCPTSQLSQALGTSSEHNSLVLLMLWGGGGEQLGTPEEKQLLGHPVGWGAEQDARVKTSVRAKFRRQMWP